MFQLPGVIELGMTNGVTQVPAETGTEASTPVAVPGPTGVMRISTVVPVVPLPDTVIVSPPEAEGSLETTPDGVYVAQAGLMVVDVVDVVVVVVVVVVVPPPPVVHPKVRTATPATSTDKERRLVAETFFTGSPKMLCATHVIAASPLSLAHS